MLVYLAKRLLYAIPIGIGVGFVCFMLVHLAPGDPLSAVVPADAPAEVVEQLKHEYGMDRPLPIQFGLWMMRVAQGDLGHSVATGRSVSREVMSALWNSVLLAIPATLIGFVIGCVLGGVAGYFRGSLLDRVATTFSVVGVSVPHYWLGIVLVILFSAEWNLLPAMGAGPGGSQDWHWDWAHLQFLILPAVTMSVIPMGIVTRTVRALVADILSQEFVSALRAKGLGEQAIFGHIVKNAAATSLAVMGLQLGYLLGGSILIETVFSWPGTGFLLNSAIFQRDIPLLQGTILVLALFFVALNLIVDVLQTLLDPRIKRV